MPTFNDCYICHMVERLYIDMDGVLVDFDARADEFGCRKHPGKDPSAIDWNIPKAVGPDYWANMRWTPGGKAFWDSCRKLCSDGDIEMGILTAMDIPAGVKGKNLWVHWNTDLDNEHFIIVRHGVDKSRFAAPGRVLVDDTQKNIDAWVEAGGIGILYTSPDQAFKELIDLI